MKKLSFYGVSILFIISLCLVSCRRDGRNNRNRGRSSEQVENSRNNKRERTGTNRANKPITSNSTKVLDAKTIYGKYRSAVFMIFTSDGYQGFQGSGFFVNNQGLAVSNYHVFKGTSIGLEQIKLNGGDTAYHVTEVIAKSKENDFILFKVGCNNESYIPIANRKPAIGDKVYAIGSPKGLENTLSDGLVSQWRADNVMQTSVPIDHGSSGGALINEYGQVVGITTGTFDGESSANLNIAISIDVIKSYL